MCGSRSILAIMWSTLGIAAVAALVKGVVGDGGEFMTPTSISTTVAKLLQQLLRTEQTSL